MGSFSARRILPACAISAACAVAVAVPSAASATPGEFPTLTEQCSGGSIKGSGSSAQKVIQTEHWNPEFSKAGNLAACAGQPGQGDGKEVKIEEYHSTGSGEGLESWGVETKPGVTVNFGPKNAYIGTEIAPNEHQEKEILEHGPAGAKILTIPVAQPAIAILLHLPAGCTGIEGGPEPGRYAMTQQLLEEIFAGHIKKWSQLEVNGIKFTPGKKEGCNAKKDPITRVVREDGSGTTDGFKKFLGQINTGDVYGKKEGNETWSANGEKAHNTNWPAESKRPVDRGNGGGGLVTEVANVAGTIGYANLADARKNAAFDTVGVDQWAYVEDGAGRYAEPSTNGENATKANSNCEEEEYTNGHTAFPPASTTVPWNEVTVARTQPHYVPCYLTFDLSLTKYKGFEIRAAGGEAPTEAEARTAHDYVTYELNTEPEGGQSFANGAFDYLGDPTSEHVLKEAKEGAEEIGWGS